MSWGAIRIRYTVSVRKIPSDLEDWLDPKNVLTQIRLAIFQNNYVRILGNIHLRYQIRSSALLVRARNVGRYMRPQCLELFSNTFQWDEGLDGNNIFTLHEKLKHFGLMTSSAIVQARDSWHQAWQGGQIIHISTGPTHSRNKLDTLVYA